MDIRNIKGAVPEVSQENILQEIYKLGIEQFEGYRNIENYPYILWISIMQRAKLF